MPFTVEFFQNRWHNPQTSLEANKAHQQEIQIEISPRDQIQLKEQDQQASSKVSMEVAKPQEIQKELKSQQDPILIHPTELKPDQSNSKALVKVAEPQGIQNKLSQKDPILIHPTQLKQDQQTSSQEPMEVAELQQEIQSNGKHETEVHPLS